MQSGVLRLQPLPESVREARRHVADRCRRLGCPAEQTSTAVQLTSEVVTNAVLHAKTMVTLAVDFDGASTTVAVRDHAPDRPVRWSADEVAADQLERGRGLCLVDRSAAAWGVREDGDGKTVWFRVGGLVTGS